MPELVEIQQVRNKSRPTGNIHVTFGRLCVPLGRERNSMGLSTELLQSLKHTSISRAEPPEKIP
jgi:hypothetical protein